MNNFEAKRVTRSCTIELNDKPAKIFPLFTPEEENKWAVGWNYKLIYPQDGQIDEDLIFETTDHDHGHRAAIWVINKYDLARFKIEYLRIEPGIKIGKIQIACKTSGAGNTLATIIYTYTGLSELGNTFIENFTDAHYKNFISHWEKAINHYLETGETLVNL